MDDLTPPHDIEVEQSVIGAALTWPRRVHELADTGLRGEHFYRPGHERLWQNITDLIAAGQLPDPTTVMARITGLGPQEAHAAFCGHGPTYLADCMARAFAMDSAVKHAVLVREKYALRKSIEGCTRGIQMATRCVDNPADVIAATISEVAAAAEILHGGSDQRTIAEQVQATIQAMEVDDERGLGTGITRFDELFDGFTPGSVTLVGARPSVGKSAFAMEIALHNAIHCGHSVGVVSLEMRAEHLLRRAISQLSGVQFRRVKHAKRVGLTSAEWSRVNAAAAEVRASGLWISDSRNATVSSIRHAIQQRARDTGVQPKLWVVDYLQLMGSDTKRKERRHEVDDCSRGLKLLAEEMNMALVVLSQLNRGPEAGNRPPQLSDLRESGSLEQDADNVILLHRALLADEAGADPTQMSVIVGKQRNGSTFRFPGIWDGDHQLVLDQAIAVAA